VKQRSVPSAAIEGVLGALARGALGKVYDPAVPARMLESISQVPSESDQGRFYSTMRALGTRAGALALTGRPVPVSWLSPSAAEEVLLRWKNSRIALQRQLWLTVTSLALSSLYSHPGPVWDRIGYPGPLAPPPDEPKRLDPLEVTQNEVISCDFVIVGSGAGGGCTAALLAEAGFDVVVIEKGGYYSESDFNHVEPDALRDMYLYGMKLTTSDLGVQIIAGSTLGGGTTVNYSTSFKTEPKTLAEWARVSGIDAFTTGEMADSLDAAARRLNVNTDSSAAGKRDELLEEGLKRLGWHVDALPRAVRGCTQDEACGYCGFGCRVGAKQSSMRTWLEDASASGAKIIVRADVRRVRINNERATGIEAVSNGHRLVVNARKAVIVGAGAIETPALLLRSGLRGQVGQNLRLHPGTAAFGTFEDDVRMWEGTLQARYSSEHTHWDNGYGPIFETVPAHPGAGSQAVPWISAADHAARMEDFAKISFCAVLPRDQAGGRVRVTRSGAPRIDYKLTPADERRITEGTIAAAKVMEAAGAKQIHSLHYDPIGYTPGTESAHEEWADAIRQRGYVAGKTLTLFSYHQMGSCRMGVDPSSSAIGPENETHEVKNLFVVDASTFPTASGVNPMLSVYGIAHRAGLKLAARFS
jgi:choline dehydrogenase-like flavoprotein